MATTAHPCHLVPVEDTNDLGFDLESPRHLIGRVADNPVPGMVALGFVGAVALMAMGLCNNHVIRDERAAHGSSPTRAHRISRAGLVDFLLRVQSSLSVSVYVKTLRPYIEPGKKAGQASLPGGLKCVL